MSEDYTKLENSVERRRRMNNLMEWSGSLVFAEDSISLSIYDLACNNLMEWSGSLVFAEDSISLSIYDLACNTLENPISHST
jgi:hypothetical protein